MSGSERLRFITFSVFFSSFVTRCISLNATKANDLEKALRFVENVQSQKTCDKVVYLDLALDHKRWTKEALMVVQVANWMTSLWRAGDKANNTIATSDALHYRTVRSIVTFSPEAFGSAVCFDKNQYKDYKLFCPYAFKNNGSIEVIDIGTGDSGVYDYTLDMDAIWWHDSKRKALTLKPSFVTAFYAVRLGAGVKDVRRETTVPLVRYKDGVWIRPYFDCFGGKIWMVTYLAPFYNASNQFLGVVSLDIELNAVDINQCDAEKEDHASDYHLTDNVEYSAMFVEFLGTHRCKPSTQCVPVANQGFQRGSYECKCKPGYYFPDSQAALHVFNGSAVEHAYDLFLNGDTSAYVNDFECLPCSEGCRECVDDSPCIYTSNAIARIFLETLNAAVIVMAITLGVLIYYYRKHKVVRASSPRFLIMTVAGVVTMYISLCLRFPTQPTVPLCIAEQWFYHMGFVSAYSSIIIKTWRVAVIFRVRSAQRMALTDAVLMRRVMLIISAYLVYMMVWTITSPPTVGEYTASDGLIFKRCSEQDAWLEVIAIIGDLGLLTWGMYVCYQVRNAPSAYNESKYVSWAIYNAMFVTCFATVLRFMIRNSSSPDVMFVLDFALLHSTSTTMLLLIIIHKVVHIRKVQRVTEETKNQGRVATIDRAYMNQQEESVTEDQEQLLAQVERLQRKVVSLEAKLQKQQCKNTSRENTSNANKRGSFINVLATPSTSALPGNKKGAGTHSNSDLLE
ncbi:probable G-protein coupled receptor CG31760 [Nematostella vectensis]|uniref:probable G-protein coupled receptor CG31760 n=1 Tax=Nematostella vectensis TaxID=45351 RepID=UPI0013904906|nr:probable G-protein coupled receptor CG31760 [Nematostella vectensis]